MNKEELENKIIDYIDGKLDEGQRTQLEAELAKNPEALQLYEQLREVMTAMDKSKEMEPSGRLQSSFDKMLKEEAHRQPRGNTVFFQPVFFRVAAAVALVISGIAIGYWIHKNNQREDELLALKIEVETTKQMMRSLLDNQQSASQRIEGTQVALSFGRADDDVVRALVWTMNADANSNVRLAAFEALSKFQNDPEVRKALIKSLSTQKDPVVQIALIQLLVKMKEKTVVKELENIVNDEMNIKAVKDEAYTGILKLS